MQYKNNDITCIIPNFFNPTGEIPTEILLIDEDDNVYTFKTYNDCGVEIFQTFLKGLFKEGKEE